MELRRVAEVLLRTQSSPLPALTPSISKCHRAFNQINAKATRRLSARTFASSSKQCAIRPSITTTPRTNDKSTQDEPVEKSSEDLAKSLWTNAGIGGNQRGIGSRSQNISEAELNGGSSAVDLLSALNLERRTRSGNVMDPSKMVTPYSQINSELMKDIYEQTGPPGPEKAPLRLVPSTGRTVAIGGGVDVARGFRLLEISCSRNKIKSDFRKQMFHERGGLRRKRLRRERWRKQFMLGFKATVHRVKELKKQGW